MFISKARLMSLGFWRDLRINHGFFSRTNLDTEVGLSFPCGAYWCQNGLCEGPSREPSHFSGHEEMEKGRLVVLKGHRRILKETQRLLLAEILSFIFSEE